MATRKKQPKKKAGPKIAAKKSGGPKAAGRSAKKSAPKSPGRAKPLRKKTGRAASRAKSAFPIVGLGASAGGLEALGNFFLEVPPDCGMAFVVVTHQHRGHVSMLSDLLKKSTEMRIVEASDGLDIEPNHIYLNPSDKQLAIQKRKLYLMEPAAPGSLQFPIDYFFRSLSTDQKESAIGIVLSGTGTDGTLGARAIKAELGITMAQEPKSAKFGGMPNSIIATGLTDYVLPVGSLAAQLVSYVQNPSRKSKASARDDAPSSSNLQKIFIFLRDRLGHDFSSYKVTTLHRRINRRMGIHQIPDFDRYIRFLEKNPQEIDLLFKEMLIGVTSFFRDSESFALLTKKILPDLLKSRAEEDEIRVWVPGCSTGEEAYSLAIIFQEQMSTLKKYFKVQIFATDLDRESISIGRAGLYPAGIAADVTPERLRRFFTKEDARYRISSGIREMVLFAEQNIIKDPPFTRLDMISCRNLLIYFNADLQRKLVPMFHYVLRPKGILFLGSSETLGPNSDFFEPENKKIKIFKRKESLSNSYLNITFPIETGKELGHKSSPSQGSPNARTSNFSPYVEDVLLKTYTPPLVLVNDKGNVVFIHGRTGDFLEPPPGAPNFNIYEMAREGLRHEIGLALRHAVASKAKVYHKVVRIKYNGGHFAAGFSIDQIHEPEALNGLYVIAFYKHGELEYSSSPKPGEPPPPSMRKGDVTNLERELEFTKESLQATVEELGTANEELKSTNEELQSTNEELQSSNEELETSREELQSLNEELLLLNAELEGKIMELSLSYDDMQNLLANTNIAMVFLDEKMNIKRYSKDIQGFFKLIESDVGRPITDISSNLSDVDIAEEARHILDTLEPKEMEVETKIGTWSLMRLQPYRTTENVIAGVVVTFLDINTHKELKRARELSANIINTVREPMLVLDEKLSVFLANQAYLKTFMTTDRQVMGESLFDLGNRQWDIPKLKKLLGAVLIKDNVFESYEITHEFPKIGRKTVRLNARRLIQDSKLPVLILLAFSEMSG